MIGPAAALGYHDLVHDHVFFVKDRSERLGLLYKAYRDHPKLSLSLAGELAGAPFDAGSPPSHSVILAEALHEGKHAPVQASFYVEHRGRLSILKAAIDLFCHEDPAPSVTLPATFRDGLRVLRTRPSFHRYALLWQVFLWGFGGFYLEDRAAFVLVRIEMEVAVVEVEQAVVVVGCSCTLERLEDNGDHRGSEPD